MPRKQRKQARQLNLLPNRLSHGGSVRAGKRKEMRPIDPKRSLHVILKSSRAKGAWSFLNPKHRFQIEGRIHATAKKYGVKVYRVANVGNHLHLLVKTPDRVAFRRFLRETAGRITMMVTRARKGSPLQGPFWDSLAYSRVVSWGREFRAVTLYLIKNIFEGEGLYGGKEKAKGLRPVWLSEIGRVRAGPRNIDD